jgi:hypothetical protein
MTVPGSTLSNDLETGLRAVDLGRCLGTLRLSVSRSNH